jgi:hypothetical protein
MNEVSGLHSSQENCKEICGNGEQGRKKVEVRDWREKTEELRLLGLLGCLSLSGSLSPLGLLGDCVTK